MTKPFTGRHMALSMLGFFAVVIAVNLTMATLASRSFGGTVVDNSYVASQNFNRWLDAAERQKAKDFVLATSRSGGRVTIAIGRHGAPLAGATLSATATHPLGALPERALAFHDLGGGKYRSADPLPAGRWRLQIEVRSGGARTFFVEELAA